MDEADLTIDVSDHLYEALQRRADANGCTVDEEACVILIAALQTDASDKDQV